MATYPSLFLEHSFDTIQEEPSNSKSVPPMRLVAEVFRTIAKSSSHKHLRELYTSSKLDSFSSKFFPPKGSNEWIKFVEDEKLTGMFPDLTYLKALEGMINEDKEGDKIVSYIEHSVPREEIKDQDFCNAVLRMIFKHLCSTPNQQDKILTNVTSVLRHLLRGSDRKLLQVGAVYEMQRLFHSTENTQKNTVEKMCHFLHECGALSGQSYDGWMSDKGNGGPGKEALLLLLNKWISSLPPDQQEEDDEDDEEDRYPFQDEEEEEEREPTFEEEDPY